MRLVHADAKVSGQTRGNGSRHATQRCRRSPAGRQRAQAADARHRALRRLQCLQQPGQRAQAHAPRTQPHAALVDKLALRGWQGCEGQRGVAARGGVGKALGTGARQPRT